MDICGHLLPRAACAQLTLNAANATFAAVIVDDETVPADITLDAGAETATFTFVQPPATLPSGASAMARSFRHLTRSMD